MLVYFLELALFRRHVRIGMISVYLVELFVWFCTVIFDIRVITGWCVSLDSWISSVPKTSKSYSSIDLYL